MATSYTVNCIERAINYMAESLEADEIPSLEDIAEASGLSKFHFNRLYRLITGETTRDTITRLRLARAANLLKDPKVAVTDAAFMAGYSSSQAFAKALRRVLNMKATEIRQSEERLASVVETLVTPLSETGQADPALKVELASFEPFEVIATRTDGTYPSLNSHYYALFEAAGGPDNVLAILGHPYGDIGAEDLSDLQFDCALKVRARPETLPENCATQARQGGAFLLTRHVGDYAGLPDAIDRLYRTVIANPDIKIADEKMTFHYLDDPEETPTEALRTDIYLPLETT